MKATVDIAVLDDSPYVYRAIQGWLDDAGFADGTGAEVSVWPVHSVEGLESDLRDEDIEVDLLFVDPMLGQGTHGALKACAVTAEIRPHVPVVMLSQMENEDRFLYGLAGAAWFGDQLRGIVPKVMETNALFARQFAQTVHDLIEGNYEDPVLGYLRADPVIEGFRRFVSGPDDVRKWRAIYRQPGQELAARVAGVEAGTLAEWQLRRIKTLDFLWDEVSEHTPLGGPRGRYAPLPDQHGYGQVHNRLRVFVQQQASFFLDPYLDEREVNGRGQFI